MSAKKVQVINDLLFQRESNTDWQQLLADFSALEPQEVLTKLIETMLTLLDM